jgi:hypothetical protein
MIESLVMCLSVVVLLPGCWLASRWAFNKILCSNRRTHPNLIGGVLLFLFGLYYRPISAAGTSTLAKVRGWLHMIGAIVFPRRRGHRDPEGAFI